MGSSRASMYTAIPELLRSRSARHELSGLACGPLLGRGCAAVLCPKDSLVL